MKTLKDFIKEKKWKNLKKDQWLILFLAGILLLVIAIPTDCGSGTGTDSKENDDSESMIQEGSASDYGEQLEKRLANALSQMEGVGQVQVMITFQDDGEAVVEKDTTFSSREDTTEGTDKTVTGSSQSESSEETVYNTDSDDGEPFVKKKNVPTIEGVLVIAQGGGNKTVASNISEAVEALFGLEVHKIKVVEMNMVQEGSD